MFLLCIELETAATGGWRLYDSIANDDVCKGNFDVKKWNAKRRREKRGRSFIKMAESERSILIGGMFCCIYASHSGVVVFFFVFSFFFSLFTATLRFVVLTLKLPLCVYIVYISCSVSFFVTSFDWDCYRGKNTKMLLNNVHSDNACTQFAIKEKPTIKIQFTTHERQN